MNGTEENFDLNWSNYTDHLREMLHEMMKSNDLTDITIVCDDKRYLRAHKVVLGACSPFFKEIVNDLPHDSMVYLKGIQSEEMQAIIEFMYLGEASFSQLKMNQFLEAANNLEIKEISKNIVFDISEKIDDVWGGGGEGKKIASKANNKNIFCPECDKKFFTTQSMRVHLYSVHKGIRVNCSQCDFQANRKRELQIHIQTAHGGKFFECNFCDYKAPLKTNLNYHIQAKRSVQSSIVNEGDNFFLQSL